MSYLRGSANYVWCTTSVLGKGATGAVFQGVDKNNGEPVAVKTFNQLSHMRPVDVQMREFQVLKKVKHENIVKLLAIEEEQDGRGKVIVMELCTGGSLFNILDDPENTYGLSENEFLLVLEHLSAGMKHLRDNNLVHRDLKPGNIMKFICDDGRTIFKLTDFGAARELNEDQQFVSLYGTEEYLHPDMYERAVLRKPVGKTFGATVDLWSIGVTLYHVATGNLPFRPFGGRRNKETMYYITTKKSSGVISGTQISENGPIQWCRELPRNCRLSFGLKKIITPLLAGLLEVDRQKIWSFDRFFTQVTDILSRKVINIYNFHTMLSIKIYLDPDDKITSLKAYIHEQTDILSHSQIILLRESLFNKFIEEITPAKGFPLDKIQFDNPLLLFSRDNNNVVPGIIKGVLNNQLSLSCPSPSSPQQLTPISFNSENTNPPVINSTGSGNTLSENINSTVTTTATATANNTTTASSSSLNNDKMIADIPNFPIFSNLVSVENDASQAKLACSIGHCCKRIIDQLAISSKLSEDAVNYFINLLSCELTKLINKVDRLGEMTKLLEKNVISTERIETVGKLIIQKYFDTSTLTDINNYEILLQNKLNKWRNDIQLISKQLYSELAPAIRQLYQRYVKDEILRAEWDNSTRYLSCPWKTKASQRAATLVERLRDGWQHLLRDRATRTLTYNDEQFHVLERIKITETGRRIKSLLENECVPILIQRSEHLADWYKMVQTIYLQSQILDKDLDIYERSLDTFSYRLSHESNEYYETILTIFDKLPDIKQTVTEMSHLPNVIREKGTKTWHNICDAQQQIEFILSETDNLIDKINYFSNSENYYELINDLDCNININE